MADSKAIITAAARTHGISPSILWGVFGTESSYGHDPSTSSAGAEGPLQLEPGTARSLGVKNPQNLVEAANGAAKYLAQFKSRGTGGMLSAYNAGPAGGYQADYVKTTLANAKTYGSEPAGAEVAATKSPKVSGAPVERQATFDQAAYKEASTAATIGKLYSPAERQNNPLFTTGVLTTKEPSRAEYTTATPGSATASEPTESTPARPPGVPGQYVHPIPGFTIGRTDQGVDASAAPGTPIKAIGDGKVLGIESNWYKGQPFVYYELTSGPAKGKVIYVAEQIAPTVKPGQEIRAGQTIGKYASAGTGIETGFATRDGQTLAKATTGYSEGQQTNAGKEFADFMKRLK